MRRRGEGSLLRLLLRGAVALLLMTGAVTARAQVPIFFDGLDWTLDRGNTVFNGPGNINANAMALREGRNDLDNPAAFPGVALRRWVWPFTRDLTFGVNQPTGSIIDNPSAFDAAKRLTMPGNPEASLQLDGNGVPFIPAVQNARVNFAPAMIGTKGTFAGANWKNPNLARGTDTGFPATSDYRTSFGGYSFSFDPANAQVGDPNNATTNDYAYTQANFVTITRQDELARLLPNAPADVYRAVHLATLASQAAGQPIATWTSGDMVSSTGALRTGRYAIDIHSPGDGTLDEAGVIHANVRRAIVRVSWFQTVVGGAINYGTGAPGAGGINDPINSRLFIVDLEQAGWIRIVAGGGSQAAFPYGGGDNQLAVTLYSITPDNLNSGHYGNPAVPPVVTADAVRFTPVLFDGPQPPGLTRPGATGFTISPTGRILATQVSTAKIPGINPALQPLTYVAREESILLTSLTNPPTLSFNNPTDANSGAAVDPTGMATVPVFYCIDNRNFDVQIVDPNFGNRLINSADKVIWRYVGVPDADNRIGNIGSVGGTEVASPLLANVRCRDGVVRPMIYFATTNPDGSVGHVYALDPIGSLATRRTTAYWVYPSYRPLLGGGNEPANAPGVYNDPNYTLPPGLTRQGYPATTWPNDEPIPYVDGDIVQNTDGSLSVKADTRVPFGGVSGSPVLMDDPSIGGPFAPQVLIVPNRNGRLYAFDAGGRGDFGAVAGIPAAGTTQRLWTFPRVRGDYYHLAATDLNSPLFPQLRPDPMRGFIAANPYAEDEKSKVSFPNSPSYNRTVAASPLIAGGGDGYLYGIAPARDRLNTVAWVNGRPQFLEKTLWQYPGTTQRPLDGTPSTAAIYKGNIYFTAGGRAYAVPELVPDALATLPVSNTLTWVYPFTNQPPFPSNPPDDASAPLEPGFNNTAPLLINRQTNVNLPADDVCFVVQGNGRLLALNALPQNGQATALIAAGQTSTGANTRTSPIAARITGMSGLDTTPNNRAVVIADDDGAITAFGMQQNAAGILPQIWRWFDTAAPRSAAALLVGGDVFNQFDGNPHGMLINADEGGQVRAYGVGSGVTGTTPIDPIGEPPLPNFGAGRLTIDMRVLDFYTKADYDSFGIAGNAARTPGKQTTGANYQNTRQPRQGNLAPRVFAVEWGEYLYITAWGVYKAQSTDPANPARAYGPPQIEVVFTVSQDGRSSRPSQPQRVPALLLPGAPPNEAIPGLWPGDLGLTQTERDGLAIYGIDPINGVTGNPQQLPQNGDPADQYRVYPWVAKYRIHIVPTRDSPYTPGAVTYQVTARATIRQTLTIQPASMGQPAVIGVDRADSNILRVGQHDYVGKSASPNAASPNDPNTLGENYRMFVANPLAVTVRGFGGGLQAGPAQFNMIGWGGDVQAFANAGAGALQEVMGNGNRLFNPLGATTGGPFKPIFAPTGMVQDGTSKVYAAVDNLLNPISSLFLMDRSNLHATTGRAVVVGAVPRPLRWLGGPSSVMNPLPWDALPNDGQDTTDYPSIASTNVSVTSGGSDLTNAPIPLRQPIPGANGDQTLRVPQPTELKMTINVPRFQPANVNRGPVTYTYPQGPGGVNYAFGAPYMDINGNLNNSITGPLSAASGQPVNPNPTAFFPAGGYTGEVYLPTVLPGDTFPPPLPPRGGDDGGGGVVRGPRRAARAFEVGLTVPPTIKLRIAEQTIDLGKQPHGAGFSDKRVGTNAAPFYNVPFRPTMYGDMTPSPWDDDTLATSFGVFFRPFTLFNESNVNLRDVRIAKLNGVPGAAIGAASLAQNPPAGVAASTRLASDQIDNLSSQYLFGLPFVDTGGGTSVGNIGLVSSFDHASSNSNPGSRAYSENYTLWPRPNPFVTGAGVTNAGLPTTGILAWGNQQQPQPTVRKPRVGDTEGTVARIPDHPYDLGVYLLTPEGQLFESQFTRPKVGMAIPLGTPSGTYSAPIYAFEDHTPIQWRELMDWTLNSANYPSGFETALGRSADGVLNTTLARSPIEAFTDPTFTLKVTVREARLTNNVTRGTLSQIDPFDLTGPGDDSANLIPEVFRPVITDNNGNVLRADTMLYWTTNRTGGIPAWAIGYSMLPGPSDGFTFARSPNTFGNASASWFGFGNGDPFRTLPDYTNGVPGSSAALFPAAANPGGIPFLQGTPAPGTERHASPAVAKATNPNNAFDTEAYLFWQGEVMKRRFVGAANQQTQVMDSRTFYISLNSATPGLPDTGAGIQSFLNDPALNKLGPKPVLLKLPARNGSPAQRFLYLFWYAGNTAQTALYYNVNATPNVAVAGWTQDRKLPMPEGLVWQSDPYPVYRQIIYNGAIVDVVDLVFTGVLRSLQKVEVMMSRYLINRQATNGYPQGGELTLLPFSDGTILPSGALRPSIVREAMARIGATDTYMARDASWYVRNSGDANDSITLELYPEGSRTPIVLNRRPGGGIQRGRFDSASGLIYYDVNQASGLGGQIVVDPRSGTVSFPNVPPRRNDLLVVSYTPQVLRLNTTRDQSNIVSPFTFGIRRQGFEPKAHVSLSGNHTNPIAILDRGLNPRASLVSPVVVFNNADPANRPATTSRLWTLYRKTDPSGAVKSGIFYKAMRLMIRLPNPMLLSAPDMSGNQQIVGPPVFANGFEPVGPYEIDWVRGRIYFTELDEGREIRIASYTSTIGVWNNLTYRVAWGDEISATAPQDNGNEFDLTIPEVAMPADGAVNEGQITAYKDPFADKLWLYWASTRAGTTDLYYQTIAPQLYPLIANER